MEKETKKMGGGSPRGRKTGASSSASNDDTVVETTATQETQPTQEAEETEVKVESPASEEEGTNGEEANENQEEEAAKVESKAAEVGENEEEANENQEEEAAKVKSKVPEEGENEEEAKPDSVTHPEKDESASQNDELKGAYSSQPKLRRDKRKGVNLLAPIQRAKTTQAQEAHKRNLADHMEIDDPMEIDVAADDLPKSPQLTRDLIIQMWETQICQIEKQLIEKLFGRVTLELVCSRPAIDGYFLSADGLVEAIAWQTSFSKAFIWEDSQRRINLGQVRDQKGHFLCWDYVSTDLVSEANVSAGWTDAYHALSAWHLCMACRPDRLGNDKAAAKRKHMCYSYFVAPALTYMKYFGIPPPETNPLFSCQVIPLPSTDQTGRIQRVLEFDRLEDALGLLPSLPFGADLIVYSSLFRKKENVYYGPLEANVSFRGYHSVIIESVKEYRGDIVAVCKMSNGTKVCDKGYVHVSLTTMFLIVDVHRTKKPFVRPTPKPRRLLSNFVAVQVVKNRWKKRASSSKPEKNEEVRPEYFNSNMSESSSQPQLHPQEAEPEYFEKRNLEDLWKDTFPVGTEWDQQDAVYDFNWDFKNLEEALEEGGKLYGKKVYVFGCTESHSVNYKNEKKDVIVPAVVCIESSIPPSDKIGVASVQGEVGEIIPMKNMKMDWVPYVPLEQRDRQVDRKNFPVFILGCSQGRSALKHSTDDHVKKFNYCFPYINDPFKVDESEHSTVVKIMFPSEPPVECEYDWVKSDIEEFTDNLIKEEALLPGQKDAFQEFVKEQSDIAMAAYDRAQEAREEAKEGLSQETKKAYKEMKLYKFYPLTSPDTPDTAGIEKSPFINRYFGKAHEVL
ncbi:Papain-like cysteine peptidase superfamily [Arabidopsis suecica]|uniref:Papain-like cysteine peptidase superfamily n=1 Tax=Arabidopsis suecica TaxID=45249 RepID=A0A8T1Y321_ARASU|nr:Papain-like cysteine peptidase superfamily [Arabidopsis suecica]